jgi:hypothetical protein
MSGDNGRGDPQRVSQSVRQCLLCRENLELTPENFGVKSGKWRDNCRRCDHEQQIIRAGNATTELAKSLNKAVDVAVRKSKQAPDMAGVLESYGRRLHLHAHSQGKTYAGDDPLDTMGNFLADVAVEIVDSLESSNFEKLKVTSQLTDMVSVVTRHQSQMDDVPITEAEVRAALRDTALEAIAEDPSIIEEYKLARETACPD